MPKAYKGQHSLVLASVKPGQTSHPSLKAAAQLCRRTGMRLRLVAAIEPVDAERVNYGVRDMFDFTAIARHECDQRKLDVEDDLRRAANSLEIETKVEISVVSGTPGQVILADAVVSGASLIVTGAAPGSHHFVPKGFSTALTLMSECPIPVLLVNDSCPLDLVQKAQRILVADDLSDNCERAVLVAFDLAVALGQTDLHHVHANALTMATFARNVEKLRELSLQDISHDADLTELWEQTHRNLLERLRLRAPGREHFLEIAGGSYWPEIRDGSVETQLEAAMKATQPDITVFGRHHPLRRRPFAIGKVPFHFMLSQNRALLVVPPT